MGARAITVDDRDLSSLALVLAAVGVFVMAATSPAAAALSYVAWSRSRSIRRCLPALILAGLGLLGWGLGLWRLATADESNELASWDAPLIVAVALLWIASFAAPLALAPDARRRAAWSALGVGAAAALACELMIVNFNESIITCRTRIAAGGELGDVACATAEGLWTWMALAGVAGATATFLLMRRAR